MPCFLPSTNTFELQGVTVDHPDYPLLLDQPRVESTGWQSLRSHDATRHEGAFLEMDDDPNRGSYHKRSGLRLFQVNI